MVSSWTELCVVLFMGALLNLAMPLYGQQWSALVNQPPFKADNPLLLPNGDVMVHQFETNNWWELTPDNTGDYIYGTWTQLASMPSGYAPTYFASAVLPDGRVLVEGGEYNCPSGSCSYSETNLGAIYNPATNAWTAVGSPSGDSEIGDAESAILPSGTFMLGSCCSSGAAFFNASNLTWSYPVGSGGGNFSEEGWTLLPNGDLFTVNVINNPNTAQIFSTSTQVWNTLPDPPVNLVNTLCSEIGPAVLLPDGDVFATGGLNQTAIYDPATNSWSTGPSFPSGLGTDDGPAALLPNGNVLLSASAATPCYSVSDGTQFFEFNGTTISSVPNPPNSASQASYVGGMLVLPTGQVLYTSQSNQIEIFTPGGSYQTSWEPTVTSISTTLYAGSANNVISGTQFTGLSQAGFYGDDAQAATNFPVIRIVNDSTGDVFYASTHNASTMAVATGNATVSTEFDLPSDIETGSSQLYVVANGIPSAPVSVTINPPLQTAAPTNSSSYSTSGGTNATITFTEMLYDSTPGAEIYWTVPGCAGSVSGSSPIGSGGSFTLVYQSGSDCNPSGTMYATAPGHSQSPTVAINF